MTAKKCVEQIRHEEGKHVMALEERIRKLEEEVKTLKSHIELGWESTVRGISV